MSTYKRDYTHKKLDASERLQADLEDLLTGPTSSSKAREMMNNLFSVNETREVVQALEEMLNRYRTDSFCG